jgi:hypothetical protein
MATGPDAFVAEAIMAPPHAIGSFEGIPASSTSGPFGIRNINVGRDMEPDIFVETATRVVCGVIAKSGAKSRIPSDAEA